MAIRTHKFPSVALRKTKKKYDSPKPNGDASNISSMTRLSAIVTLSTNTDKVITRLNVFARGYQNTSNNIVISVCIVKKWTSTYSSSPVPNNVFGSCRFSRIVGNVSPISHARKSITPQWDVTCLSFTMLEKAKRRLSRQRLATCFCCGDVFPFPIHRAWWFRGSHKFQIKGEKIRAA